jgi:hypothetical protein
VKERALRLLPGAANEDGEFAVAARMWDADVVFVSGADAVKMSVRDGKIASVTAAAADATATVRVSGPEDGWRKMLQPVPPPFYQDLFGAGIHHGFLIDGEIESVYPYYPALRRLVELLRENGERRGGA